MDRTSFALMSEAIREMAAGDAAVLARLRIDREDEAAALEQRHKRAWAGADLIARLIEHEPVVRGLIKVGALVDFPTYSTVTSGMVPGSKILLRAEVLEVYPTECRVRLTAPSITNSFPVHRDEIVGIEKALPR